ncbi:MAG TPA: PTS sugar transporter subunit IIA [Gemmataceae bacterium]|nr:PTS sugar transporter subunit IIA [Gemmataceae bacterium]
MGNDVMGLEELATYLHRDVREVSKLASRGKLPGQKVGGEWRFRRVEINQWLEGQLSGYTDQQLTAVEAGPDRNPEYEPLLAEYLSEASVAVPLAASTKASALRELVALAERSWQVYDPAALLEAVRQREEMASTALPSGVAIPHPHRPLPSILGEPVIAYGRTASPIPFGAERGGLTDVFFLVASRDDRTHLRVLARLSRLLLRPGFLDELRAAETPAETFELIVNEERELLS